MSMALRAADYHVIVDGQSLVVWPSRNHPQSFPMLLRDIIAVPVKAVGISGYAWQQLDNDLAARVGSQMQISPVPVYVMVGGTTQIGLGQNGQGVYDTEVAVAELVRTYDPAVLIIGCTTTPSTMFTAPQNDNLADLNTLVMSDPDGAFDLAVDLAGDPRLDDPTDLTHYADGTHPTYPVGTGVIAEILADSITTLVGA